MMDTAVEPIEIDLLLEAVFRRYGYDFRSYARASIERRIRQFQALNSIATIADLIPGVLHDEALFSELARTISVSVTEMFRDPFVYRTLREKVLPLLRTYPYFKVWHAGCATGEEVYSLAILLREEGLLDRATIYATDFNESALARAREGIYPLDRIQEYTRNYQQAGGTGTLSDHYHARYGSAVLDRKLRKRITFAAHNLATDSAFGEIHLVFCRNVFIYFNNELQDHVARLFLESLIHGGFLCLGTRESLRFTTVYSAFEELDSRAKLYKKTGAP